MRQTITVAFALGLAWVLAQGAPARAQAGQAHSLADAKPGDVRVFCSTAFHFSPELLAQVEKAIGKTVVVEYGGVRTALKEKMLKGQEFEVAISLPDANEELFKAGKILADTYDIGLDPIAFAVRGAVPKPDVSTPEAAKATLLKAASVKWTPQGFARDTARKVLSTLGIADAIKDSSTRREEVALGPGEYEIVMGPISEILTNTKVTNLGVVVAPLQAEAQMQAVIGRHANDERAARALIAFLQSPAIDPALKANGIIEHVANGTLK